MRMIPTLLALTLSAVPAMSDEASDRATTLAFITENQIDSNLYNLLAATIPSTESPLGNVLGQIGLRRINGARESSMENQAV